MDQLVRLKFLDIGFVLFFPRVNGPGKLNAKLLVDQHPAILTSRLITSPYISCPLG